MRSTPETQRRLGRERESNETLYLGTGRLTNTRGPLPRNKETAVRKTLIVVAVLALIGGGVAIAASTGGDETLRDPNRADCPGLIECPLTGELICADECPLLKGDEITRFSSE